MVEVEPYLDQAVTKVANWSGSRWSARAVFFGAGLLIANAAVPEAVNLVSQVPPVGAFLTNLHEVTPVVPDVLGWGVRGLAGLTLGESFRGVLSRHDGTKA